LLLNLILPYLSCRNGDAFYEYQEGIRFNAGAVPAAVNSE